MNTSKWLITCSLAAFLASGAVAKEHDYQKGVLLRMDSTTCGFSEKDGKTLMGQIVGTDGQHKKAQETLCQEYVLQGDRLTYRIRPRDEKHPVLLPIGETAQFRIHKDKLVLRVPEADGKEREYQVISMVPREDVDKTQSARNSQ